jgi:hypothetical protein
MLHAYLMLHLHRMGHLLMCNLLLPLSHPLQMTPLEQLLRCSYRLHQPLDWYTPHAFIVVVLPQLAFYRDVILHLEWQNTVAEEITVLE